MKKFATDDDAHSPAAANGVLIVGATGGVGRRLLASLRPFCRAVFGTSRRGDSAGLLPFDLADSPPQATWLPPDPLDLAIIAAAETRADVCETEPVASHRINVLGTIQLIEQLWARRILPVFLSSDYVFGADAAESHDETAPTSPINEYGKQKVEVEAFLRNSGRPYVVLRLGRVLIDEPGGGGILDEACQRLLAGTVYHAADDQRFSTTQIDDATAAIVAIFRGDLRGVIHAAAHPTSRFELVARMGRALQLDEGLVQACKLNTVSGPARRPRCTVLRSRRLGTEVPFTFADPQAAIDRLAAAYLKRK